MYVIHNTRPDPKTGTYCVHPTTYIEYYTGNQMMCDQKLPSEINQMITDMACYRRHNGHASVYGFIIVIDVDFDQKIEGSFETKLGAWVLQSLDKAHRALNFETPWHFVSNIRSDQRFIETSSDPEDDSQENSYQICLHTEPSSQDAYDYPLFRYSHLHSTSAVHASAILQYFEPSSAPDGVSRIAISGVDQYVLRDQWSECIAKDSNEFDHNGKGYMVHPMRILIDKFQFECCGSSICIRETSFRFGWPEYPGDRGNDW